MAIFDYEVTEKSPSGSCHLRLLEGLCDEFDFTVFATTFDNPRPDTIHWVRVPSIPRPLAARFISYYLTSSLVAQLQQKYHSRFDIVQGVEGYTRGFDISYVHYCHQAYLRGDEAASRPSDLRGRVRHLDHRLRAARESRALGSARLLVVPSPGLADELEAEHGLDRAVMRVLPNPVELNRLVEPAAFDRQARRQELGAAPDDLVVAFVALGHFERKGLPALLEAIAHYAVPAVRLLVVGGKTDLIRSYQRRADRLGISRRIRFVGMQSDIRPYLWASDALAAPSSYEVFSLTPLQAAAAGLPLVVTTVPGVAPFFRHGVHGLAVTPDAACIGGALNRLASMDADQRRTMGEAAKLAVALFDVSFFVERWRAVYQEVLSGSSASG